MLSKYEKIAIAIIIILFLLPYPHPMILYLKLFGGGAIGYLLFHLLIIDSIYGFTPSFLTGNIISFIGALIGLSFFAIPYYEITNRIFREPHKKRKILIAFILIYVILSNIYTTYFMLGAY